MPALASISVTDAEATPVAHAFDPVTTDGAIAKLANRSSGSTPQGFETLLVEVRQPVGPTGAYRVLLKGYDPTEVTVSGVTSVDRANSFELMLNLSQKSTAQERKNLAKIVSNLLAHATIVDVVENVEPIY